MRRLSFALVILATLPYVAFPATPGSGSFRSPRARVPVFRFGEAFSPSELAQDALGAERAMQRSAPEGYVIVFGSARLGPETEAARHAYEFGRLWGGQADKRIPLMTGGGPGIMEAANRGAREMGMASLGFSTPFLYEKGMNEAVTDGHVFHSIAQRQGEMVDRARGAVFVDGGVGTMWELFEVLTKLRTGRIAPIPVVLLGTEEQWQPHLRLLAHLVYHLGTTSDDILKMVKVVPDATTALEEMRRGIGMPPDPTAPLPPCPRNLAPSALTLAREVRASRKLLGEAAPNGFVAVFGGSAPKPGEAAYEGAKDFAEKWTRANGGLVPIATGGGPGIMEAANRGARLAGGNSIGMAMVGVPGQSPNRETTHSYPFRSFAFRESELIDHSRAAVFVRGGVGTVWEFFELLTKISGGQTAPKPIILLGPPEEWRPMLDLLRELISRKLANADLLSLIHTSEDTDAAVELLQTWSASHLSSRRLLTVCPFARL